MITKDATIAPITQKTTRVLGALCQELRMKTKCIFITSQYHTDVFISQLDALGACVWVRNTQLLGQVLVPDYACVCLVF